MKKQQYKKILLWFLDLGIYIGIIFILVLVIQKWIIAPFDVSGASMCDTLNLINGECRSNYGEKIIINEAGYAFKSPARGEVVVFQSPTDLDKYFVKRIIGIPGDIVEIKSGEIYITPENETTPILLKEDYLNPENRGKTESYFSDFSVFEIPEEKYFLLGDNRKSSTDSRSCFESTLSIDCKNNPEKAFVNEDLIKGKAWFVWWPVSNIRLIKSTKYPELD